MSEPGSLLGRGIGSGVHAMKWDTIRAEVGPFLKYNRVDKHGSVFICVWVCCAVAFRHGFVKGGLTVSAALILTFALFRVSHNDSWQ